MRKAQQKPTGRQPKVDIGAELLSSVREMTAGIRARGHRPGLHGQQPTSVLTTSTAPPWQNLPAGAGSFPMEDSCKSCSMSSTAKYRPSN